MHEQKIFDQFLELRVQGYSVPKISEKIGVPRSTLYEWNENARPRIHKLRLLILEQTEERILGTQPAQFESLAAYLKAVDKQLASTIANGDVEDLSLPQLIRVSGSLRRQLHRLKVHVTDPLLEHARSPYADQTQPIIVSGVPEMVPPYGPDTPPPPDPNAKPGISGFLKDVKNATIAESTASAG